MKGATHETKRFAPGAFALPPRAGEGNGMGATVASDAVAALAPTPALPRARGREHSNTTR